MALKRLDKTDDWKVADESTDIRGWKVTDATGQDVGKIDGLLFEPADQTVKYAIAEIEDRCVLLPVGQLDIDDDNNRVQTRGYARTQLLALRPYRESEWTETEEREHFATHVPGWNRDKAMDYEHPNFRERVPQRIKLLEEKLRIGKRPEKIGEVVARKHTETETVTEDVNLRRERVEVERHPVNRPVTGNERITTEGETIRVPVFGEELVTEKRPVVKEEIEIKKTPVTEKETVREPVRHEELEFVGTEPNATDLEKRDLGTTPNPNLNRRPDLDRNKEEVDIKPGLNTDKRDLF